MHLTSNLKAVRGQLGADCHGGHVGHKPLLLCFQCDTSPPLSLKGIAFNQSSSADWWKPLCTSPYLSTGIRPSVRGDATLAAGLLLNSHAWPDASRWSLVGIAVCPRVYSLEDKALGINSSSLEFTPVFLHKARDLSSIQFYEYIISLHPCAPIKRACVCKRRPRVCHLKYTR